MAHGTLIIPLKEFEDYKEETGDKGDFDRLFLVSLDISLQ